MLEWAVGKNPMAHEKLTAELYARSRQVHGGMVQQAIAAIENALVDLKARRLGVPVFELLGGAVRNRLRLYWSHCGSYRLPRTASMIGRQPLQNLGDLAALGNEVREQGFGALKTNIFLLDNESRMFVATFLPSKIFQKSMTVQKKGCRQ